MFLLIGKRNIVLRCTLRTVLCATNSALFWTGVIVGAHVIMLLFFTFAEEVTKHHLCISLPCVQSFRWGPFHLPTTL